MQITLTGDCPSKKNSRKIICRGSRPLLLPSEIYETWHQEQMWLLKKDKPHEPIDHARIQIVFYPSNNRKADLTNRAESVMDLLVDAGYLLDDNYFVVETLLLAFGGVDRSKPRVEIEIN